MFLLPGRILVQRNGRGKWRQKSAGNDPYSRVCLITGHTAALPGCRHIHLDGPRYRSPFQHGYLPIDSDRCHGKICDVPCSHMDPGSHECPDTGFCPAALGLLCESRRLSCGPDVFHLSLAAFMECYSAGRGLYYHDRGCFICPGSDRPETAAGFLHDQPVGLHYDRLRHWYSLRRAGGNLLCLQPRVIQGHPVSMCGCHPACGRNAGYAPSGGMARTMPLTTLIWLIAAGAIIGVPLTNGFVAKWLLYDAALESGAWMVVIIAWLVSTFTGFYILKATVSVFYGEPSEYLKGKKIEEASTGMLAGMVILAAFSLFFGIAPQLLVDWLAKPAMSAMKFETSQTMTFLGFMWINPRANYCGCCPGDFCPAGCMDHFCLTKTLASRCFYVYGW